MLALLLCAVMLVSSLAGCTAKKADANEDPGAYITMYLTDDIFDFDPANAYTNTDTLNVVSLMFDTLFKIDSNGKVTKPLVKDYKFKTDKETKETTLELVLKETYWSNGTRLQAEDVVFAWKRLLSSSNDYAAASLLYDIKNARAAKEDDNMSIDNVGIEAIKMNTLKITFEGNVDKDQFLLNLTSVATAPLLESYVTKNEDWAKKPSTMVTSGPFKLGKIYYNKMLNGKTERKEEDAYAKDSTGNFKAPDDKTGKYSTYSLREVTYFYLERNLYYFRDQERDSLKASVSAYRILVDCSKDADEILNDYINGKIFYMGSIPLSLRDEDYVKSHQQVSNALSTFILYMNQNAFISEGTYECKACGATVKLCELDDEKCPKCKDKEKKFVFHEMSVGKPLFSNAVVRQYLSAVINREAIANSVVYAEAATGLVSPGVFENGKISKKTDFRTTGSALLSTSAMDPTEARNVLVANGIVPDNYHFSIKVAEDDEVNVAIVEQIAAAWCKIGFDVTVKKVQPIVNNDYLKEIQTEPDDVCDDRLLEALQRNNYEVLATDYLAFTAGADSVLMNFASSFSGMALDMETGRLKTHTTGYMSVEYNTLMEAIYYLPYYASLQSYDTDRNLYRRAFNQQPYVEAGLTYTEKAILYVSDITTSTRAETQIDSTTLQKVATATTAAAALDELFVSMREANFELSRAYSVIGSAFLSEERVNAALADAEAAKDAAKEAIIKASEATVEANKAANKANEVIQAQAAAAKETMNAALATLVEKAEALENLFRTIQEEVKTLAQRQKGNTLYELMGQIYAQNGITPTTDSSKWAAQKATLLHKAEALLMTDLPVIPVVFNKNAVMYSDQLSSVNYKFTSYYTPYYFTKTSLKNYKEYTYYSESQKATVSLFSDFPNIDWSKIGK